MRGSRLGVAKAWSRRKPLAGAPPLGSEYQVYSVASPRKWRHTSIQPSAERRGEGLGAAEGGWGWAAPGGPGVVAAGEGEPRLDPAQCGEAGEVFGADEGGSGFVDQRESGVEVAEEEERFGDAGFGRRQEGIPESRFGGAFGFLGAGIGGEDVDYGEAEALLREIDIQPANGVFGRRGGGAVAAQGSSREDANAVIDAGGTAGSDMRPAVGGESLAERHAGPGAEFGEGDDIGIVIGDGSDNADIARPAAVLNVPGEKFHAP